MQVIYNILCKMLGSPPSPNEKFNWEYYLRLDEIDLIEREQKRRKVGGAFENYEIKKMMEITPIEFYEKIVPTNLDDYVMLGNDPRNAYNKYYEAEEDTVVGGNVSGFYNVTMEDMSKYCSLSIQDNVPVQFDCDVSKYIHHEEELMDIKCYDYKSVLSTSFENLNKEDRLRIWESYPTHAMTLAGVDMLDGKPVKWRVENSWGLLRTCMGIQEDSDGYYTMSHEWFEEYGFATVVHKKYFEKKFLKKYNTERDNATVLPYYDPMVNSSKKR